MIKSIIKEIFIIILLVVVIALILGIVLYDYNPNSSSKTIPDVVEPYALSEEVQNELNETLKAQETQSIIKTYKVDGHDLKVYASTNSYDMGKPNPFSPDEISEDPEQNEGNATNTTGSENNTTQNTSQGKFLNTIGK